MADEILSSCNVAHGCGMTRHWIRPNVRHIAWNFTSGFDFDHNHRSRHVIFCAIQIWPRPRQKKNNVMSIFKKTDLCHLGFQGPIMDSLKSSCTTSYRSSIDIIALNSLVFEKIAFLHFGDRQTNRLTNRQTNRWTSPLHYRSRCRERPLNKAKTRKSAIRGTASTRAPVGGTQWSLSILRCN